MITLSEMWFWSGGMVMGMICAFLHFKYFLLPEILKDHEDEIAKKIKRKCD